MACSSLVDLLTRGDRATALRRRGPMRSRAAHFALRSRRRVSLLLTGGVAAIQCPGGCSATMPSCAADCCWRPLAVSCRALGDVRRFLHPSDADLYAAVVRVMAAGAAHSAMLDQAFPVAPASGRPARCAHEIPVRPVGRAAGAVLELVLSVAARHEFRLRHPDAAGARPRVPAVREHPRHRSGDHSADGRARLRFRSGSCWARSGHSAAAASFRPGAAPTMRATSRRTPNPTPEGGRARLAE